MLALTCSFVLVLSTFALRVQPDQFELLWPDSMVRRHYEHAVTEWQKGQMEKYGARTGPVCYSGCCGLGHRNIRSMSQAFHAWAHGQPLFIRWPNCNGVNSWTLLQDEQVMRDKFNKWISVGVDRSLCQLNSSNEPYFDPPDFEKEIGPTLNLPDAERLQHPVAKWYHVVQQTGINNSPLGSIIARFLQQEFQGHVVMSVHLRLGNGEQAAIHGGHTPKIPRNDVFKYVSQTADRIAEEVLNVSAKNIRLFVASDTHAALEEFQRFDSRVFFFSGGTWVQENAGIPVYNADSNLSENSDGCVELEHTVMLESTLLGYADVLLTPQKSSYTEMAKGIVMSRGGHWCENQQWKYKQGEIPDPSTIDVDETIVRSQDKEDDEDSASAMHEWEAILNCPSEKCNPLGYKCYYEKQGLQSRAITW
jgi:hypothetical protein